MADESHERIERLETAVRRLLVEVADLRQDLRSLRSGVAVDRALPAISPQAAARTGPPQGSPTEITAHTRPAQDSPAEPIVRAGSAPDDHQESSASPAPAPGFLGRILDPPRAARAAGPVRGPRPAAHARPAQTPRAGILPSGMSFEDLVGRYGAMALAALAIMSGVGIFLSWAIAQNLIGPTVRVGAGFAAAVALATLGWRLRNRDARTFGNTLMGIALAVVHVVAWGAGPELGVMPNWLALAIAAAASVALAILAWRSNEESLFVVGVGGALIAPFVTTPGRGDGEALLVFGFVVLTTALWGMRDRPWSSARWVLGFAGVAYASAAMTAAWSAEGLFSKEAPVVFALCCAWGALALGGPLHAPGLVRAYLAGGIPPLFWNWDAPGVFTSHLVLAAAGTLTLFAGVHRTEEEGESWIFGTILIPLGFMAAALLPLDDAISGSGAGIALAWGVAALGAGFLVTDRRRHALWTVTGAAGIVACVLMFQEQEIRMVTALSLHGIAMSWLMRVEGSKLLLAPAAAALVGGALVLWVQFDTRAPYAYTPFLTAVSFGALVLVLGIGVMGWNVAHTEWPDGALSSREAKAAQGMGVAAAFIWGHAELAEAYSPDLSVFLLIIYYAASGVAAIFIGRRDSHSDLRRIGLGLAVFAALKAVAQGYALDTIGLRVGSFLLVGAFLLAVAYWYRAAGDASPEPDTGAR